MSRHEVPEQDVLFDSELRERPVDDRRRRLSRTGAGQLPLRGERDPGDAGAAVTGRLGDEQERGVVPLDAGSGEAVRGAAASTAYWLNVRPIRAAARRATKSFVFTARKTTTVIRRRVTVRGHVQGVFFRETTRRRAQARGVAGWVANKPDGSVEAVLEGENDAVEAIVAFVREGPRGARVDWVDVEHQEPEGLSGFEIR